MTIDWHKAGCARDCSEQHTYAWGRCALAPASARPEPTVSMPVVYDDAGGLKSIGFDTYTVAGLAELIEPALHTIKIRLGPNARGMLERGEEVRLTAGEYASLALAAADAIVHRNDVNNAEQSARTTPDNSSTSGDEADNPDGAWTPDPPIGCLTATTEPPVLRDPCPHCESSSERVPRHLMAGHVATMHPEVTAGGPGISVADAVSDPWVEGGRLAQSGVDTPGCDCGHDGMGISWHGDDCPWRCGILDSSSPEPTPSQRPELRDQLADATVPLLLDTLPKVIARARGYEVADAVLALLCREWPWLRAVAEERDQSAALLAAVTAEAKRRGVISIDGIRNIVSPTTKEQRP